MSIKKYNTYTLKTEYNTYNDVHAIKHAYNYNGCVAIELVSPNDGSIAIITVCIPNYMFLKENQAFVDTNNCPWAEEFIIKNKLGINLNFTAQSGYCQYPLYEFDLNKLEPPVEE